jgi:hypothetical protein
MIKTKIVPRAQVPKRAPARNNPLFDKLATQLRALESSQALEIDLPMSFKRARDVTARLRHGMRARGLRVRTRTHFIHRLAWIWKVSDFRSG